MAKWNQKGNLLMQNKRQTFLNRDFYFLCAALNHHDITHTPQLWTTEDCNKSLWWIIGNFFTVSKDLQHTSPRLFFKFDQKQSSLPGVPIKKSESALVVESHKTLLHVVQNHYLQGHILVTYIENVTLPEGNRGTPQHRSLSEPDQIEGPGHGDWWKTCGIFWPKSSEFPMVSYPQLTPPFLKWL